MGLFHDSPRPVLMAPSTEPAMQPIPSILHIKLHIENQVEPPPQMITEWALFCFIHAWGALYLPNEAHAALLPSNWLHLRNSN